MFSISLKVLLNWCTIIPSFNANNTFILKTPGSEVTRNIKYLRLVSSLYGRRGKENVCNKKKLGCFYRGYRVSYNCSYPLDQRGAEMEQGGVGGGARGGGGGQS